MSKVEIPEVEPYDDREYVWEQKWRCVSLDEIALPARIRDMLVGYTKLKRIPSIVLNSRSPGTGKTTTARALAREVGCKKPLYVNASLKTDIANIRTEVHRYSTGASVGGNQKVVILDECLEENEHIKVYGEDGELIDKRIGDYQIGDKFELPSFNMETRQFEADQGEVIIDREVEVFEVKLESGAKVTMSANHPLIVETVDGEVVEKTLETGLSVGDRVIKMNVKKSYTTDPVVSIEPVGVRRVVNLEVSKNHTFITGENIVTHNCERLSHAAQESLKGLMEQVSKNCIFVMTTNNKNNLVDPLLSRSRVIDYEWNEQESRDMVRQIIVRMISILNYEGIEFDKRVLAKLVQRKFPDNRRLMGTLQDYAQTNGKIDEGILSYNQSSNFRELVEIMKGQNFNELKQWVYDNQDRVSESFLGELARYLIEPKRVNDDKHAAIIEGSSIPDVIEFLGEEQKAFHQAGDKWLFLIRILMVLGGPSGVKWNSEFNYVE